VLLLLTLMFVRFIHIVEYGYMCFTFSLLSITLCECATFKVHSAMDLGEMKKASPCSTYPPHLSFLKSITRGEV
jgi:hypothetical protein